MFFADVTDTASNMNAVGVSIPSWREAVFLWHHYCADHVLQLTVVKAYSGEVEQSIIHDDDDDDDEVRMHLFLVLGKHVLCFLSFNLHV